MTEPAKHTPTPWKVEQWEYTSPHRPASLLDTIPTICTEVDAIAQTQRIWRPDLSIDAADHEQQANADFIVWACNSHKGLLEACKALMGVTNHCSSGYREAYDLGIAAIDKATRKEGR